MNAVDRAAEILAATVDNDRQGVQEWWEFAEALAAADPTLLVTDEIQAVLDAVSDAVWSSAQPLNPAVSDAWMVYLASRTTP